ncbi:MAG: hypothetical protein IIX36_04935, partial [Clostridia bacterium]|nr:hypothetical protein [Clostridia bacterium]
GTARGGCAPPARGGKDLIEVSEVRLRSTNFTVTRRKETLGTARGVTRHAPSDREGFNRSNISTVKKYQLHCSKLMVGIVFL